MLVMNGDDLLGVITDRDIAARVGAEHSDPQTTGGGGLRQDWRRPPSSWAQVVQAHWTKRTTP